jgi:VCBS repeat-containing protein
MTQLADGVQYEYRVRAETPEGNSAWAKLSAPITATNEAPVAVAGPNYQVITKQTLNVAAPGVVGNDTDVDSPQSFIKAVSVTGPANAAQFSLNADGSFTYRSKNGFVGIDSFTYKANNGVSTDTPTVPLSGDSATVTVQIQVFKK